MSNIATGIDTQEFETTGYITGNDSIKLLLSGLAKDSLEPFFQRCKTLQNTLRSDIKTNSEVLTDIENEWHDITMPVNISHPGMYRVTNDYSATKDEIGISVICDDVIIDGNGHTFRGLPGHECVGFAAISDTILKNISITNFSTRECYGGIVMLHVQGCTISDTHNTGTLAGISIGSSENVTVSRNTIQDYSVESSASELYGIASMDVSGIRLEGNHISNISPSTEGIISSGIYLSNTRDISCVHNDISGPISVGIIIEPALFSSGGYFDISDNKVCSYDMFGIFVGGGYGYVTNNSVEQGTNGIMLTMDDSSIVNNRISDNLQRGLEFSGTNNTLSQNILTNNTCNLNIEGFREEDYLHHIDRTNLINGKPFIYIRDSSNVTIGPEDNPAAVLSIRCQNITIHDITTGYNKAGIMLINGTNISISHVHDTGSMSGYLTSNVRGCRITDSVSTDNKIYGFIIRDGEDYSLKQCRTAGTSGTGFYVLNSKDITLDTCFINSFSSDYLEEDAYGIYFDYSTNITIQNSTFSNSPYSGIFGTNTEELVIINSTMEKNQEYGISLMQCNQVSINDSIISQNEGSGIAMDFLSRFTIYQNILSGNHKYGLLLLDVSEGIVTNNLFNNTKNMEFVYGSSPLTWNTTLTPGKNIVNGPNLGGNFWANPQGQGFSQTHGDRGDGICNASYILNDENIDFLPLAIPSEEITPNFIADQVSGTPPLTVRFIDISTGNPSSWNWTFGDGTISHEQNPIHIYTGTGRYSVTLEVTGEDGKQGILRRPTLIIVNPGRITGPIGIFQVDSLPQNGSVFLDGGWIGYTPLKPSGIPAGTHQIKITREGFRDWSGKVMINQGQFTIVPTIKLQPI